MYRVIDCATWDDAWFADELDPCGKLFFLYLITNRRSTSCGAFEVTIRQMAFETGLDASAIQRWLTEWAPRVMWWPEHNIVWLRSFWRHQRQTNDKTRTNAKKIIATLPPDVQQEIVMTYPDLAPDGYSLPIAYPSGMHQMDKDKDKEKEQESAKAPAETPGDESEDESTINGRTPGHVYALVDAFAEGKGLARGDLVGKARKTAYTALAHAPPWATPKEIHDCTSYLMTDPFWSEPGKLKADKVVEALPEWRNKGRPALVSIKGGRRDEPSVGLDSSKYQGDAYLRVPGR